MEIITFASSKGGVGKTTCSILTANNLAARDYKVLVLDLDAANNSSTVYYTMGIEGIENTIQLKNAFEALGHRKIEGYIINSRIKNIDIIASNYGLFDLRSCSSNTIAKTLENNGYDYVIIDTAPGYDNIIVSAITASDYILTPTEFTSMSYSAAGFLRSKLLDEIPDKVSSWYLLYVKWQEAMSKFNTSIQSQMDDLFQRDYNNILDIHIPFTTFAVKYTQTDESINVNSNEIGKKRLALSINKLVDLLTDKSRVIEKF